MDTVTTDSDFAVEVLCKCVSHARRMLASQIPQVRSRHFDFIPCFEEMTTLLFLAGVTWRFGEQFELNTDARTRGFLCVLSMLVGDGVSEKAALRRVARLHRHSRAADGKDVLTILAGYGAVEGDGSLAAVFERFRDAPEVSGAPYRILRRSTLLAAAMGLAAFSIPLMLGTGLGFALGVGGSVGGSVLAAAWALYWVIVKSARRPR